MLKTTEFDVVEYLDTEELREGLYKALSPNDELHLYKHGNIGRSCPKRKGRSGCFS